MSFAELNPQIILEPSRGTLLFGVYPYFYAAFAQRHIAAVQTRPPVIGLHQACRLRGLTPDLGSGGETLVQIIKRKPARPRGRRASLSSPIGAATKKEMAAYRMLSNFPLIVEKKLLVVGLMNPGDKYRYTRHNAGAMGLDELWPAAVYQSVKSLEADVAEVTEDGVGLILLKPQTFMNLSGRAVVKAMKKFRIEPKQLVVLHDEVELPVGVVKHKAGGGHKGHNGLRSIMADCGSADFHRIRIGVGRPNDDRHGIADYLLSFQPPAERVTREQLQPVWQSLLPR